MVNKLQMKLKKYELILSKFLSAVNDKRNSTHPIQPIDSETMARDMIELIKKKL